MSGGEEDDPAAFWRMILLVYMCARELLTLSSGRIDKHSQNASLAISMT